MNFLIQLIKRTFKIEPEPYWNYGKNTAKKPSDGTGKGVGMFGRRR